MSVSANVFSHAKERRVERYSRDRMLRGFVTIALLVLNLAFWAVPVVTAGIIKLLLPGRMRRSLVKWTAENLADRFVAGNERILRTMVDTTWDVAFDAEPPRDGRSLVISNHVSWLDILVLFIIFHQHRAPLVRFFLKQELVWMPFVGQASWALDFPFMKRYTPEYLERHPEKRGQDLETTREACRKYRKLPVTIANFVEGTRFSEKKRLEQRSPYRHLLKPRTGGIAFVFASMGDQLDATYDVTIGYPGGDVTLWDFVTNRVKRISVRARRLDVPREFYDEAITRLGPERDRFRSWVEQVWRDKDEILDTISA